MTTFGYFTLLLTSICYVLRTPLLKQMDSHSPLPHARAFLHLCPRFIFGSTCNFALLIASRYLATFGYFKLLQATFEQPLLLFAHTATRKGGFTFTTFIYTCPVSSLPAFHLWQHLWLCTTHHTTIFGSFGLLSATFAQSLLLFAHTATRTDGFTITTPTCVLLSSFSPALHLRQHL